MGVEVTFSLRTESLQSAEQTLSAMSGFLLLLLSGHTLGFPFVVNCDLTGVSEGSKRARKAHPADANCQALVFDKTGRKRMMHSFQDLVFASKL